MPGIIDEYRRKHPRSAELYQESLTHFPGGVTHDTRYVTPFPVYMTHGQGPRKWDVDGNEYVDYVMGHGSLLLGHSHPRVMGAVAEQVMKGTHLGGNTELEISWARAIKRLVPSVEKVRFHSSGTEATMMALRLARAYTGRTKFIKFRHHFHGWHDYVVAGAERPPVGVPPATLQNAVVLEPNDIGLVERTLESDKDIAAVILEPTGAHMGYLPVQPSFLRQLREVTASYGVVLIFDEVVTGFRVSKGGAQLRYGIRPDLTTFGKIVAGGLPGAAVGGRADIMDMIAFKDDPEWNARRRIAHQGTYNANPLSAVAGSTCLGIVASEPVNQQADRASALLKRGLQDVLARLEVPGHIFGVASVVNVALGTRWDSDEPESAPHDKLNSSTKYAQPLKRAMLNEGVDMIGGRGFLVSATHTDEDVDETVSAFERAVAAMQRDGIL